MKPSAILINTSRGPVVDSAALADALNNGRLAGAGSMYLRLSRPSSRTIRSSQQKNVIATPHVAFATKEALEKRAIIVFDNVDKWLKGTPQNVM